MRSILFVPEIMGKAVLAMERHSRGAADLAVDAAVKLPDSDEKLRRFLQVMADLPVEEAWSYASGLKTESLVARASGDVKIQDRLRYRYAFNAPFRPYVLVASDVMQEGIDLHRECSHVIHYDLAWNPARLEQRVGRIDRLGSKVDRLLASGKPEKLTITRRYIPGTVDERMFLRVRDRERWFKFILGHRPEWEVDNKDESLCGPPLPTRFGDELQILLGS